MERIGSRRGLQRLGDPQGAPLTHGGGGDGAGPPVVLRVERRAHRLCVDQGHRQPRPRQGQSQGRAGHARAGDHHIEGLDVFGHARVLAHSRAKVQRRGHGKRALNGRPAKIDASRRRWLWRERPRLEARRERAGTRAQGEDPTGASGQDRQAGGLAACMVHPARRLGAGRLLSLARGGAVAALRRHGLRRLHHLPRRRSELERRVPAQPRAQSPRRLSARSSPTWGCSPSVSPPGWAPWR